MKTTFITRFVIGLALFFSLGALHAQDLTKLKYNHPSLVVDLGVGLWAWPIPCDADDDGDFDLIVSCPDKPSNGIWLFENATGSTSTNKFPIFKPARKLSGTVHYVMPSYTAGKLRVLTPGHEHPSFATTGLKHAQKLHAPSTIHTPTGTAKGTRRVGIRHNQWRLADLNGDKNHDLIVGIEDWSDYGWDDAFNSKGEWTNGKLHGFVYWLENKGSDENARYENPTLLHAGNQPIDTYGCPSPNFVDFDNDGDLDLLCGEFTDGFTYFKNTGDKTKPRFEPGVKLTASTGEPLRMFVQMIVPIAFDWDQDGDVDLIVGDEDGRVALVENTGKLNDQSMPIFSPPHYFQQEADELKCGALATPVGVDWEGDGDTDIVTGNTSGVIEVFINLSGKGIATPKWSPPFRLMADDQLFRVMAGTSGGIQGPCEAKWGYTTLSVIDWDADSDLDIVYNSILGRVRWLENIGSRSEPKFTSPQIVPVAWNGTPPKPAWTWFEPEPNELVTQWRTTPIAHDFTGDGRPDLAMLDHEGYLALFERQTTGDIKSAPLLPGQRRFYDENGNPLRLNDKNGGASGRRKLTVTDWDGDGKFDLLLNSTSANLLQQIDVKEGRWLFKDTGPLARQNIEGHDVSPTTVDFNANSIPDFLGGAEDGRMYLLQR